MSKRIPRAARGLHAQAQPPQSVVLLGVSVPLARFWLSAPQLKAHNGQHQIGPIRRFAKTAIGAVERSQVKVGHGISNFPGEMIAGQLLVKFALAFRIFRPGRFGKPSGRLGIGCKVAYHLYGLLVGVTECDGHLYSARKPQKSNRLGGHFATQLVIRLSDQ